MINNTSIKEGNAMMRKTAFQVAPLFQCSLWLRILHDMNNAAYYVLGNIKHHSDALLIYLSKSKPMWEKMMWNRHYRLFNNTVTEELLTSHPLLHLTSKQADVCSQDPWLLLGLNVWKEMGCRSSYTSFQDLTCFFLEVFSPVAVDGY